MQFSAGALGIILSKAGGDRIRDGRSLTANANHFQFHQKHYNAPTHQQGRERFEAPSTSNVLKNRNTNQRVASAIISKLKDLHNVVECDPVAEIKEKAESSPNDYDRDFGILSSACGVGRNCHEGLCVEDDGWNHQDHLRQRDLQSSYYDIVNSDTTNLNIVNQQGGGDIINSDTTDSNIVNQPGGGGILNSDTVNQPGGGEKEPNNPPKGVPELPPDATIVDTMQYACEFGGFVGYDCVCDFDNSTYTGNATCTTPLECTTHTSLCDVDTTHCRQTSYSLTLLGTPGVWDAELCLTFLKPFEQTVCYETSTADFAETFLPVCNVSMDGQQCSSCDIYAFDDKNCYNFDCSNTALAASGRGYMTENTCDLTTHSTSFYIETYGCPPCYLCGEDNTMMSPVNSMEFDGNSYQCAYVQDVALQGLFYNSTCDYLSKIAQESCGCAGGEMATSVPSLSGNETDSLDSVATETPTDLIIQNKAICNICPSGVSNTDGVIVMPGSKELSCSEIETAGMDGSIVDSELCQALQDRAAEPCCGAQLDGEVDVEIETPTEAFCTLCGPDKIHTEVSTLVSVPIHGIFSCEELIELGKNGTLDSSGICLLVQLSAKTPCGCVADSPTTSPTMSPTIGEVEDTLAKSGAVARNSLAAVVVTVVVAATTSYLSL